MGEAVPPYDSLRRWYDGPGACPANPRAFPVGMKEQELDIRAISQRHIHSVDKLYRMCAGVASELISYESGVIELEVRKGKRWTKTPEVTARQFAESWRKGNRELADAVAFLVHIYDKPTPPGFSVPADSLSDDDAIAALADRIRAIMRAPDPDVLVATVRGRFDHPRPPELRSRDS